MNGKKMSKLKNVLCYFLLVLLFAGFGPFSCEDNPMFVEHLNQPISGGSNISCASDGTKYWSLGVDYPPATGTAKIAKRTFDGVITTYTDASSSESGFSGPILEGSDGNIWTFGLNDAGDSVIDVVKMTPAGVFTHYSLPAAINGADACLGPDGNIWFTEFSLGKIAKIDTSGTITEYAITAGQSPGGIASDGTKLWVAAVNGSFHVFIKSYNTSGVQQTSADTGSTYIVPGRVFLGKPGEYWLWNGIANERVLRVLADGTVLSTDLPYFDINFASGTDLLRGPDSFIAVGALLTDSGNVTWQIAKISLDNELVELSNISPNKSRVFDSTCYDPSDQLYYSLIGEVTDVGTDAKLISFEDSNEVRLMEGDASYYERRE